MFSDKVRKLLAVLLVFIFPYISIGISVRIAFTEKFIEWEYSKKNFPKDRWGMTKEERLELAKLGLRAVLSDKDMEKFKRKKLSNGKRAFTEREIKHMEDVKNLLKLYFPSVYLITLVWFLGVILLKDSRVLIYSGIFNTIFLIFLSVLTFVDYKRAFEIFHIVVFDHYSWKFKYSDTLIRVYPMKFWYDATVFVGALGFILGIITLSSGILWKSFLRKKRERN